MKLVTYTVDDGPTSGTPRVGVLLGEAVHDAGFDGDMVTLIEHWARLRDPVRAADAAAPPVHGARLLAPLRPRSMRDFLAFETHLKRVMSRLGREVPTEWYRLPAYYKAMPDTVIGPDDVLPWPSYSDRLDHELELAAVIGKDGRDIPLERALFHVPVARGSNSLLPLRAVRKRGLLQGPPGDSPLSAPRRRRRPRPSRASGARVL